MAHSEADDWASPSEFSLELFFEQKRFLIVFALLGAGLPLCFFLSPFSFFSAPAAAQHSCGTHRACARGAAAAREATVGDGIRKKKSLPGEGMGRGGQGRQWPGEAAARGGRGVGPGSYPPGTGRLVAPLVPLFLVAPVVLYWKQHQRYCVILSVPPPGRYFYLVQNLKVNFVGLVRDLPGIENLRK